MNFIFIFSDNIEDNTTWVSTATTILFIVSSGKGFQILEIHFIGRNTDNNSSDGKVRFSKGEIFALENINPPEPLWNM